MLIINVSHAQRRKRGRQFIVASYIGISGSLGVLSVSNSNIRKDKFVNGDIISFSRTWTGKAGLIYIGKNQNGLC